VERSGAGQRRSRRRRAARISASADSFDGDASVDVFGGVGVAELVDVDLNAGGFAVVLPAMVGGVVGERAAVPVDAGAERRAVPVAGAGEVEVEEDDVAAVVEEDGAERCRPCRGCGRARRPAGGRSPRCRAADFGGAGPTHVGRLEQDPVAEDVERHVFARPPAADRVRHLGDVVGLGGAGQGLGHLDGVDLVHGVGAQQVVADGPFAEGGDGGALALAGRRRQLADVGEERADRVGGQVGQVTVAVGRELEKVAAIGAQGVPGGVGVLGIDEEVVQVSGERMSMQTAMGSG
jgi:hypothetical protein